MSMYDSKGTTEEEIKKYREELKKQQEEYLKRLKEEREAEQKKKEQEKEFQEKQRIEAEKRQLEIMQIGWTPKHRALYEEMINLVGDTRFVTSVDTTGERGLRYRQLLSEFLSLPLDLGTASLSEVKYYRTYAFGVSIEIFKDDNNKWVSRYDYKLVNHPIKLILDKNGEPEALESHVNNPLFVEQPLKAIVKLKK